MPEKLITKYGNASFCEKKGYRITSRKEGNFNKMLHRLIWEDHYGEIPQNCCIIFKDGDKTNFQLSNLELKRAQGIDTEFGKAYLNKYGYMYINKTPLHHLVWENHYNKKVPKGCHIHHKDENKTNNDINNLQLISASEHAKLHAKTRNSTGFFRVSKQSCDRTKQGFTYRYIYRKNGKRKQIESISIDKLKEKVLSKNLEWKEL